MELDGAVILVTGASAGIGEATARAAAARGARVVLVGRRAALLHDVAAGLPDALAIPADVTVADDRRRIVEETIAHFGALDALVNNAGQGLHVPLVDLEPDDLRAVFELNVIAALELMRAVRPVMAAQGRGAIVNVSSGTSRMTIPGVAGYAATKAALNMISEAGRIEFAEYGITVGTVYPTVTATDFHDNLRRGGLRAGARAFPPASAASVATAICELLASGAAEAVLYPAR